MALWCIAVAQHVEQVPIIEAFIFELGKCYEQAIKERELQVLANVDTDLCAQVAKGLGLPAPKGTQPEDVAVSAALTQILAEPGPVDGRKVGIIADADSDLAGVAKLVKSIQQLCATPLVTAPVGGVLNSGRRSVIVERTLLTARSIEFDALVVGTTSGDIRLTMLLQEAFRHCKPLAAWGNGLAVPGIGRHRQRRPRGPGQRQRRQVIHHGADVGARDAPRVGPRSGGDGLGGAGREIAARGQVAPSRCGEAHIDIRSGHPTVSSGHRIRGYARLQTRYELSPPPRRRRR
jgi:hypothetical protein